MRERGEGERRAYLRGRPECWRSRKPSDPDESVMAWWSGASPDGLRVATGFGRGRARRRARTTWRRRWTSRRYCASPLDRSRFRVCRWGGGGTVNFGVRASGPHLSFIWRRRQGPTNQGVVGRPRSGRCKIEAHRPVGIRVGYGRSIPTISPLISLCSFLFLFHILVPS